MTPFRAGALVVSVIGFSSLACATKPVPSSPKVTEAAADVVLYDGLPLPPYRKIRKLQTASCGYQLGRDPRLAAARDELRVEAARVGGNAVGNIMCHVESGPPHSPCWKIAVCTGEAECASSATNHRVRATCRLATRK